MANHLACEGVTISSGRAASRALWLVHGWGGVQGAEGPDEWAICCGKALP
jgi:hypothetical protein